MSATQAVRSKEEETKGSDNPSFAQAAHILKLIGEQKPTSDQIQKLVGNGWVFKHLLRLDPKVIDELEFCRVIGAPLFEIWQSVEVKIDRQTLIIEQICELSPAMAQALERKEIRLFLASRSLEADSATIHLIRPTGRFPLSEFWPHLEKQGFLPLNDLVAFLALSRKMRICSSKGTLVMIPPRINKAGRKFHLFKDLYTLGANWLDYGDAMFANGHCDPSLIFPVLNQQEWEAV